MRIRREKYELERDAVAATALREAASPRAVDAAARESTPRFRDGINQHRRRLDAHARAALLLKPYYSTSLQLAPAAKVRP